MTSFIFNTATTLNGFLADPEDSLTWLESVPSASEAEADFGDFLRTIGSFVMGASTYEWLLAHQDPEFWASVYGDRPCFVVTHRALPTIIGADIRFVSGPVAEWADDLVAAAGGEDVWITGGGDLVGQFDDAGRLDIVRVSIAPVVLPAGKPLLPRRIESDRLTLESTRQLGQFVELTYRVTPRAA